MTELESDIAIHGYELGYQISTEELDVIRSWIQAQWYNRIIDCYPVLEAQLNQTSIEDYHTLGAPLVHSELWAKPYRTFSKEQVLQLQEMSIFNQLRKRYGDLVIADIEGQGYPEAYWRLVRPSSPQDVSAPHADSWFYTVTNNLSKERQAHLKKFWLAIHTVAGESGISVSSGSHKVHWKFGSEHRHGRSKPVFLDDQEKLQLQCLNLSNGDGVLFDIDLIHKGVSHSTPHTRISIEFAVEVL